jgi:UDPglucose--hexose-1-phosphate uridylyltransferase
MAGTCSRIRVESRGTTKPELRFDPLREEWVAYNTARNDRTFLPTGLCPPCPSGAAGGSDVPLDDFEVVVFENRFPAIRADKAVHAVRVQA